jgi:hypothetical protein
MLKPNPVVPLSTLLLSTLLLFATSATPALAIYDHPMNVALTPGDTLYVRFKLEDPSNVPSNFNTVNVDFTYSASTPSATTRTDLYDNSDGSIGHFDSVANFTHFGIGPNFIDPSLSNPVTNFCCGRTTADLTSYLDGIGMTSLNYQAGPGVVISEFRASFGNSTDSSGSASLFDTIISYSLNSLPPPVPEPGTLLLTMLAAATMTFTRRRR